MEELRLPYTPPFRFDLLLDFFRVRMLPGIETVDDCAYARTARVAGDDGRVYEGWLRVRNDGARCELRVELSDGLLPVAERVAARLRRQFDLGCDPEAVRRGLAAFGEAVPGAAIPGIRLPGCFDGFETCARAVLGQQVSLAAANKLAARVVEAYGPRVDTPVPGLERMFPSPEFMVALPAADEALGKLGVIRTRTHAIVEIAKLVEGGRLRFDGLDAAGVAAQKDALLAIKGIGPWSAGYIAMRTMASPDEFLETDAGVKHALPQCGPNERLQLAERWRPWRSYAVLCLWNAKG